MSAHARLSRHASLPPSQPILLWLASALAQPDSLSGMGYLNDAASASGSCVSLVFLPARAAAVAMALSTIASTVSFILVIKVICAVADLDGNDFALLAIDGVLLTCVLATGIIIIYGRFRPAPDTHLWACVAEVTSYLTFLCVLTTGFSISVITVILVPLASCVDEDCSHRPLAVKAICALTISLVCLLALAGLVVYDLRRTRPHAEAIIYDAEARQALLWAEEARQWDRDQLDAEQAMVARAQRPFDPAEEWLPLSARTPIKSPSRPSLPSPTWFASPSLPTAFAPSARNGDRPLVDVSVPLATGEMPRSQVGRSKMETLFADMHSMGHHASHHHDKGHSHPKHPHGGHSDHAARAEEKRRKKQEKAEQREHAREEKRQRHREEGLKRQAAIKAAREAHQRRHEIVAQRRKAEHAAHQKTLHDLHESRRQRREARRAEKQEKRRKKEEARRGSGEHGARQEHKAHKAERGDHTNSDAHNGLRVHPKHHLPHQKHHFEHPSASPSEHHSEHSHHTSNGAIRHHHDHLNASRHLSRSAVQGKAAMGSHASHAARPSHSHLAPSSPTDPHEQSDAPTSEHSTSRHTRHHGLPDSQKASKAAEAAPEKEEPAEKTAPEQHRHDHHRRHLHGLFHRHHHARSGAGEEAPKADQEGTPSPSPPWATSTPPPQHGEPRAPAPAPSSSPARAPRERRAAAHPLPPSDESSAESTNDDTASAIPLRGHPHARPVPQVSQSRRRRQYRHEDDGSSSDGSTTSRSDDASTSDSTGESDTDQTESTDEAASRNLRRRHPLWRRLGRHQRDR